MSNDELKVLKKVKRWIDEAPGPEHDAYYYVMDKVEEAIKRCQKQSR